MNLMYSTRGFAFTLNAYIEMQPPTARRLGLTPIIGLLVDPRVPSITPTLAFTDNPDAHALRDKVGNVEFVWYADAPAFGMIGGRAIDIPAGEPARLVYSEEP